MSLSVDAPLARLALRCPLSVAAWLPPPCGAAQTAGADMCTARRSAARPGWVGGWMGRGQAAASAAAHEASAPPPQPARARRRNCLSRAWLLLPLARLAPSLAAVAWRAKSTHARTAGTSGGAALAHVAFARRGARSAGNMWGSRLPHCSSADGCRAVAWGVRGGLRRRRPHPHPARSGPDVGRRGTWSRTATQAAP